VKRLLVILALLLAVCLSGCELEISGLLGMVTTPATCTAAGKRSAVCGIQCEKVIGTMVGEGHAWNRVTFSDGTERYVDATNFTYRMLVLVPDYVLKYDDEYKW